MSTRSQTYSSPAVRSPQTRQRDATLVSVLAYTGLRPGEALALTWRDVRAATLLVEHAGDSAGQQQSTKTEHARTVRLLEPLAHDRANGGSPRGAR